MTEAPQVPAVEIISPKVVKWAERINSAARKGLKSILAVCYEVFLAHEDCLRGEWLQLIDSGLLVFKRAHVYPPYGEVFQRKKRKSFSNLYRAKKAAA